MQDLIQLDGRYYNAAITSLKRTHNITDGENAGRTKPPLAEMIRDIIGTFISYTAVFEVKSGSVISAVDLIKGATFACSDSRLNAIHDMVKYTLSCLTFNGYMVDCPHIERMGYGGDGNSSTMTLQTLWDVRDLYYNWLTAWSDAMESNGDLPYVAPAFRTGGGPYWSGFIVKAPWCTYLNYGDPILIYRHYNEM